MDIAVTAMQALGLRPPAEATGQALTDVRAKHVLILFLDALATCATRRRWRQA